MFSPSLNSFQHSRFFSHSEIWRVFERFSQDTIKMEDEIQCYICQDFKWSVGHETKWCPKNRCKRCGRKGHSQVRCMTGRENLPLPDEIILKIFGYVDLKDLDQCARVSKRVKQICLDDSVSKGGLNGRML